MNTSSISHDKAIATTEGQEEMTENNEVLLGTIRSKAVGARFYDGIVSRGEQVILKREPGNVYDRNAIRVDNIRNVQIGHISRGEAATLAPLMDDSKISLQGLRLLSRNYLIKI